MTNAELEPGNFLRSTRQEQGLSMRAAGERAVPPLSSSYLAQLEGGSISSPSIDKVERLSQAYGLSPVNVLSLFGLELDPEIIPLTEAYEVGRTILDLKEPYRSTLIGFPNFLRNKGIA